MKRLIIFIMLLFSVDAFAEGYTKDFWLCDIAEICEFSDYTKKYTKNCKIIDSILIYWEYADDKYKNSLFCHKYHDLEKQCTKIVSNDTDRNDRDEDILIITGETIDYIFGKDYLNIIYHAKGLKISHSLCNPLLFDFNSKKFSKNKGD